MTDTDISVTTVTRPSPFDDLRAGFDDPDPTDLDRLAASLNHIALCGHEPDADKAGQHPAAEAMAEDEQLLVSRGDRKEK